MLELAISDIHQSWRPFFEHEMEKPYMKELFEKVEEEYENHLCFPSKSDILKAFSLTPKTSVKVVIIGQDPYHGEGQAQGLSFSVPIGYPLPPSLRNIAKELEDEYATPCIAPAQGDLSKWAEQGVLLLNSSLTVRANEPASHSKLGWQDLTDAVIKDLDKSDLPIVFMLWGKHAQKKASLLRNDKHLVLESAHPSPLSAHRGFFGCGHFKKANDWLILQGSSPIDWKL